MVVCRFFQQGYCRYGQNCRFEHVYGSKYTYHANQAQVAPPQPAQPAGCTDEQLVNQVQADVQSALRGGQWILSCYSPFKEKPIFPGISDLSPEEARLFIYEAKSNNTIEQAVSYMNKLFSETRQKYEQLLQPNGNIIGVLRTLYKGETTESPFSGQNTFGSQGQQSIFNSQPDPAKQLFSQANNTSIFGQSAPMQNQNSTAQSIFASAVQNTNNPPSPSNLFSAANKSIFGSPPAQNSSPFGQSQNTSPFGQAQNNSPFGQAQNNSSFGQAQNNTPFGQTQNSSPFAQTQNNSPFAQTQNNTPFGQTQNSSPFGQAQSNSPFAQTQNTSPFSQANVFQKSENPASIFGQANRQLNTASEPGVYSKMEDIPEADLEAFKNDRFELGFVPEIPPPHQLCIPGL